MKTKINLIVTVTDVRSETDSITKLKTMQDFCRIKNQLDCYMNDQKLTFEIGCPPFHLDE